MEHFERVEKRYGFETGTQGTQSIQNCTHRELTWPKVDDEVGFIRFFRSLPVKDDETIRIFDRGDWYTSHGDDAAFIARTVSYRNSSPFLCLC